MTHAHTDEAPSSLARWLFLGLALVGCGGTPAPDVTQGGADRAPTEPAETYSEDVAFLFDGAPILKSEIDRHLPLVRLIDPHVVESSLRRKSLTNIVLPTVVAQTLVPEEREAAFQRAQTMVSAARETGQLTPDTPEPVYLTGTWRDVGLVPFEAAMDMEVGTYSQLLDTPGSYTFFKLIATNAEGMPFGPLTEITIQRYDVPYIPLEVGPDLIQSALDSIAVEIVDEEWEHIVPPLYLYKTAPNR